MIVVSDTSPLLNLCTIERLDLLPALYTRVAIPIAVSQELDRAATVHPQLQVCRELPWLDVLGVKDSELVKLLQHELDDGEAEAVALALERKADRLLIDERKGREIAARYGIRVQGLLGVLAEAKLRGQVPEVKPLLDGMMENAGFWISADLYNRFLREMGEGE